MSSNREYNTTCNNEQKTAGLQSPHCPFPAIPPCPMPPPIPCAPFPPHDHMFRGCIAYINQYIDLRMRQLYLKLKWFIKRIIDEEFHSDPGPWNYILLRDTNHQEDIYKVYIKNGNLCSEKFDDSESDDVSTT